MTRVRLFALPALLLLLWSAGSSLLPAQAAAPGVALLQPTADSPLATPAQVTPAAPTATPPPTATPTATPSPSPSPTPTATETPTPTPTVAPFQVSPLVISTGEAPPSDGSLLWIGAAALIVLVGSSVLLLAQRQGRS